MAPDSPAAAAACPDEPDQNRWFADAVLPHEPSLRGYLRRVFPTFPDIDDLVQESYARLLRTRRTGRIQYAKAFLFATARNLALDFFRRRAVATIDGVADLDALSVVEDRPHVADALAHQEDLAMLADAVRALPDRCRQVMTLRLLYGLRHLEIAEALAISEHTVKAQLAKGMRRCAEHLAARGDRPARAAAGAGRSSP